METSTSDVSNLLEITLKAEDDFLKIKETLTRIGISSKKENIDETDIGRRNTISKLLEEWGLLMVVDKEKMNAILTPLNKIKIIPFKEKINWELCPKYHIGKK